MHKGGSQRRKRQGRRGQRGRRRQDNTNYAPQPTSKEFDKNELEKMERERLQREAEAKEEAERQKALEEDDRRREMEEKKKSDVQRRKELLVELEEELHRETKAIEEIRIKSALREEMRGKNETTKPLPHSELRKLESNLKKNSAFVRKLRSLSGDNADATCKDLLKYNLSRYISEVVKVLLESKFKSADVFGVVKVISLLYQRFSEFKEVFFPALEDYYSSLDKKSADGLNRRRVFLKLYFELFFSGLIKGSYLLSHLNGALFSSEKRDKDDGEVDESLVFSCSFLRYGRQYIFPVDENPLMEEQQSQEQIPPQDCESDEVESLRSQIYELRKQKGEIYKAQFPEEYRNELKTRLVALFKKSVENLKKLRSKLDEFNADLDESGAKKASNEDYVKIREVFEKRLTLVTTLGEAIGRDVQLVEEREGAIHIHSEKGILYDDKQGEEVVLFDDENARAFFDELFDFSSIEQQKEPSDEQSATEKSDGSAAKKELEAMLGELPLCLNKERIDDFTRRYAHFAENKYNRRRLLNTMLAAPRTALELLPLYARCAASYSRLYPEFGQLLVQLLSEEFDEHIQKKDQINIETKIKNIRFIGELTKFGLCEPSITFHCISSCLDDFNHHNVMVVAALFECCGSWLYRKPSTHARCASLLELMMKKRNSKGLAHQVDNLVQNAYYQSRVPVGSVNRGQMKLPVELSYINHLLSEKLSANTVDKIVLSIRKVGNWEKVEGFLIWYLLSATQHNYTTLKTIGHVIAKLSPYHQNFPIRVVDALIESLRCALVVSDFRTQQRRIAWMKMLSDLLTIRFVDISTYFEVLFMILMGDGVKEARIKEDVRENVDVDSYDYAAFRLICVGLDTCGKYLFRGARRKMKSFVLLFQSRIADKNLLPMDLEYSIADLFDELNIRRITDQEELISEIQKLKDQELVDGKSADLNQATDDFEDMRPGDFDGMEPLDDYDDEDMELEDDEESDQEVTTSELEPSKIEQEEFERELQAMIESSTSDRKGAKRILSNEELLPQVSSGNQARKATDAEKSENLIQIQVVMKTKGNKLQAKTVALESANPIAAKVKEVEKERKEMELEAQREKEEVKARVLEYQRDNERRESYFDRGRTRGRRRNFG